MTKVGVIREIWRFPVKSMQGDTLERCTVSAAGVLGDRAWAIRDEARKEVQWGKRYPELMLCKARYREEPNGWSFACGCISDSYIILGCGKSDFLFYGVRIYKR